MTYVQKTRNVLQNIKKNKSPQSPKTIQLIQKLLRSFHNHWMEQFRSLRNSKAWVFSKVVSLNLLDPPLVVFLIVIIVKVKLDLSHDCA